MKLVALQIFKRRTYLDHHHDGDLASHLHYLIDAREYVAHQTPPPGFQQHIHSDAPPVGDPARPAIVDASYTHLGRYILSVAHPDFIDDVEDAFTQHRLGHPTAGLNIRNLGTSLMAVMREQGIEIRRRKGASDPITSALYYEFDVSEADYEKGRGIINAYIRGPLRETPEQLLHRVKAAEPYTQPVPDTTPRRNNIRNQIGWLLKRLHR